MTGRVPGGVVVIKLEMNEREQRDCGVVNLNLGDKGLIGEYSGRAKNDMVFYVEGNAERAEERRLS